MKELVFTFHTLTYTLNNLNYGSRFCQIIHARLRLGCSDLNSDTVSTVNTITVLYLLYFFHFRLLVYILYYTYCTYISHVPPSVEFSRIKKLKLISFLVTYQIRVNVPV